MIGFLLCLCLCFLPCSARAASTADAAEPVSPDRDCTLTLSYSCGGTAFADVPVTLYQIAEVSADMRYTLTAPFQAAALPLNGVLSQEEWNVIRSTLESYMLSETIIPTLTAATGEDGQVRLEGLKPGLYLVSAVRGSQGGLRCSFDSALIALPGLDTDGRWQYDLTAAVKGELLPEPDPKPGNKLQFKVLKLWKGDSGLSDRPASVAVEIFRNGVSQQTVILSEENHWSYAWTAKDDGASWMVVEQNVPAGYTALVEKRAESFVVTNTLLPPDTPPSEPPSSGDEPPTTEVPPSEKPLIPTPGDSPQTGDTPHIMLYTVLMYVSGAVLVLLGVTGKRKRQ